MCEKKNLDKALRQLENEKAEVLRSEPGDWRQRSANRLFGAVDLFTTLHPELKAEISKASGVPL